MIGIIQKKFILLLFVFCCALIVYSQGLSQIGIEYRDDEIFYYRSSMEMLSEGNYLSPTYFGQDRFQKPVFFYWLIIAAFKAFGVNWFSARIVSVVFAALTLCLTWEIAERFFSRSVAALSCVILGTVPLFFRHAKNAVPDMALNFFTALSVYCIIVFMTGPDKKKYQYGMFIFAAMGFMIKGFAAILVPLLIFFSAVFIQQDYGKLKRINWLAGLALMALIISPWFIYMVLQHGADYVQYVAVQETQQRLLASGEGNFLINFIFSFGKNSLFYLGVLFSYFAPWVLFLIGAIPFAFFRCKQNYPERQGLSLLLAWFGVVFVFFSFVHVRINHYLLLLSIPFSILASYFLVHWKPTGLVRNMIVLYSAFIVCLGISGLAFFKVFLAGGGIAWLVVYLIGLLLALFYLLRQRKPVVAPLLIGGVMISFILQSGMMLQAGVAPQGVWKKFADTINSQVGKEANVGVASHDIHEKELQAFFGERILKISDYDLESSRKRLRAFLSGPGNVYCLMQSSDYKKYPKLLHENNMRVIQEEYVFRKRLSLDMRFWKAVFRLNKREVRDYLLEKVILLKKENIQRACL